MSSTVVRATYSVAVSTEGEPGRALQCRCIIGLEEEPFMILFDHHDGSQRWLLKSAGVHLKVLIGTTVLIATRRGKASDRLDLCINHIPQQGPDVLAWDKMVQLLCKLWDALGSAVPVAVPRSRSSHPRLEGRDAAPGAAHQPADQATPQVLNPLDGSAIPIPRPVANHAYSSPEKHLLANRPAWAYQVGQTDVAFLVEWIQAFPGKDAAIASACAGGPGGRLWALRQLLSLSGKVCMAVPARRHSGETRSQLRKRMLRAAFLVWLKPGYFNTEGASAVPNSNRSWRPGNGSGLGNGHEGSVSRAHLAASTRSLRSFTSVASPSSASGVSNDSPVSGKGYFPKGEGEAGRQPLSSASQGGGAGGRGGARPFASAAGNTFSTASTHSVGQSGGKASPSGARRSPWAQTMPSGRGGPAAAAGPHTTTSRGSGAGVTAGQGAWGHRGFNQRQGYDNGSGWGNNGAAGSPYGGAMGQGQLSMPMPHGGTQQHGTGHPAHMGNGPGQQWTAGPAAPMLMPDGAPAGPMPTWGQGGPYQPGPPGPSGPQAGMAVGMPMPMGMGMGPGGPGFPYPSQFAPYGYGAGPGPDQAPALPPGPGPVPYGMQYGAGQPGPWDGRAAGMGTGMGMGMGMDLPPGYQLTPQGAAMMQAGAAMPGQVPTGPGWGYGPVPGPMPGAQWQPGAGGPQQAWAGPGMAAQPTGPGFYQPSYGYSLAATAQGQQVHQVPAGQGPYGQVGPGGPGPHPPMDGHGMTSLNTGAGPAFGQGMGMQPGMGGRSPTGRPMPRRGMHE